MMDFWTIMGTSIWNVEYRRYIDELCSKGNPQESLFKELVLEQKKLLTRFDIGEIVRFFNSFRGDQNKDVQVLMDGVRTLIAKEMEGRDASKSAFLFVLIMDKEYSNIVLDENIDLKDIPCHEKFGIDFKTLTVFRRLMALDHMDKVTQLFREGRWTVTRDCPMLISLNKDYDHANAGCLLHKLESERKGQGRGNGRIPKTPEAQ